MLIPLFASSSCSQIHFHRNTTQNIFVLRDRGLRGSPEVDYCAMKHDDIEDFADKCEEEHCTIIECTSPGSLADSPEELECISAFCRKACSMELLDGCDSYGPEAIFGAFLAILFVLGMICGVFFCCWFCCRRMSSKRPPPPAAVPPSTAPGLYPAYPTAQSAPAGYGEGQSLEYVHPYEYQPPMYGNVVEPCGYSMEEYPPAYPL
jgi:hypothetical protein